jgi:hypothetical protein
MTTENTPRLGIPIPTWDADWEKWQREFRTALLGIDSFAFGLLEATKLINKTLPEVEIVPVGGGVYEFRPDNEARFISRTLQVDIVVSDTALTLIPDALIYVSIQPGATGPQAVDWEIVQNGVEVNTTYQVLGYVTSSYEIIWYNGGVLPVSSKMQLFSGTGGSGGVRKRAVIDVVDCTAVPPTEVTGDRYILDDTGSVNASWDGASQWDIVEFDGLLWEASTPQEGWVCYVDDRDQDWQYVDDGVGQWEARAAVSLDEAYNTGSSITVDALSVTMTVPDTTNVPALTLVGNDSTNYPSSLLITSQWDGTDGGALELTSPSGVNVIKTVDEDILVTASGTASKKITLSATGTAGGVSEVELNAEGLSAGSGASTLNLFAEQSHGASGADANIFIKSTSAGTGEGYASMEAKTTITLGGSGVAGTDSADVYLGTGGTRTVTLGSATNGVVINGAISNTSGDLSVNPSGLVWAKKREDEFIPIGWPQDPPGGSPPAGDSDVISGNGTIVGRKFSGSSVEELTIPWKVPDDIDPTYGITYFVHGVITESTVPAGGEGVSFKLSGYSVGTGDSINGTFGTEVESADTDLDASGCDTQYDAFTTVESGTVTVTDLAKNEIAYLHLERDTADGDDTYVQDVGVTGITIFYTSRVA